MPILGRVVQVPKDDPDERVRRPSGSGASLHVESVQVGCCAGWEYEAVGGAVEQADSVEA